jgi:hypothetical protein
MQPLLPLILISALAGPSGDGKDDLFRGKPLVISREVDFLFDAGPTKYIRPSSVGSFDAAPSIKAPAGLSVKVLSSQSDQVTVKRTSSHIAGRYRHTTTTSGEGFRIRFRLELTAGPALAEGDHTVEVSFPGVSVAAIRVKADPLSVGTSVSVNFWESPASKKAHLDKLADEAAAARLRWWGWFAGIVAGIVAGIWGLVTLGRLWSWMSPKYRLVADGRDSVRMEVSRVVSVPAGELERLRDPLDETHRCRTFWGGDAGMSVRLHGLPTDFDVLSTGGANVLVRITYEAAATAEARPRARAAGMATTPEGEIKVRSRGGNVENP